MLLRYLGSSASQYAAYLGLQLVVAQLAQEIDVLDLVFLVELVVPNAGSVSAGSGLPTILRPHSLQSQRRS